MNREVANLGRARSRCHFRLKQTEDLAQSYRDKLADLESRNRAIAPELELPVRFRRPNPVFARTELTQQSTLYRQAIASAITAPQSSDQTHAPLRQPCRQRIIAEQQPALAETRRQWTVTRINRRPESLLRHAERAGDLSDSEVSGHNDGRRWHRAAGIATDSVRQCSP
jgi:hypothetical protein